MDGMTALWTSAVIGIWTWIFKVFVIESLQEAINELTSALKTAQKQQSEMFTQLARHDERIHNLEKQLNQIKAEHG